MEMEPCHWLLSLPTGTELIRIPRNAVDPGWLAWAGFWIQERSGNHWLIYRQFPADYLRAA